MAEDLEWPKITIVTPSFNQAQFLEETIQSILSQGYPNLEYIIIDGGSTDGSVEIIRQYQDRLAFWESTKDRGQAHAINKGLARATGDLLVWIASDDTLLPGAVRSRVVYMMAHPDVDLVYGDCLYTDANSQTVLKAYSRPFVARDLFRFTTVYQPTAFFRKTAMARVGHLDENLHYALDAEYWVRLQQAGALFAYQPGFVATYRLHSQSKTVGSIIRMHEEAETLIRDFAADEDKKELLADHYLQTAIRLVDQGQIRQSWSYVRQACTFQLRPRILVYVGALMDRLSGLKIYHGLLTIWLQRRSSAR